MPIVGERLTEALQVAELSILAVRDMWQRREEKAPSYALLNKLANGQQATTRRSIRDGLADLILRGDASPARREELSQYLGGFGLSSRARSIVWRSRIESSLSRMGVTDFGFLWSVLYHVRPHALRRLLLGATNSDAPVAEAEGRVRDRFLALVGALVDAPGTLPPAPFGAAWVNRVRAGLGLDAGRLISESGEIALPVDDPSDPPVVIVASRFRAASQALGYSDAVICERLRSESGLVLTADELASLSRGDDCVVPLSLRMALESILGVEGGLGSLLGGDGPPEELAYRIAAADLENLLLERGEFEPWHPGAIAWAIEPGPLARVALGLPDEVALERAEAFDFRLAAVRALTLAVRAADPGMPLLTREWAVERLRTLHPTMSEADRLRLVGMAPTPAPPEKSGRKSGRAQAGKGKG